MSLVRDNMSVDIKVSSSVGRTNVTWWRGEEFVGEGESVMIELLVESLVESVVEFGRLYTEEVVKLTNLTMAETSIVLARQRRDYGIDQDLF